MAHRSSVSGPSQMDLYFVVATGRTRSEAEVSLRGLGRSERLHRVRGALARFLRNLAGRIDAARLVEGRA